MSAKRRLALLAVAVAGAFGALLLLGLPRSPEGLRSAVAGLGLLAPLAFLAAWAALTPALCSGTLLALAGGLAFGLGLGSVVGLAGAMLGGLAAFALARRVGTAAVEELCGPRLQAIKGRLERRGFLAVLCARAAPGVPTTLLNYACGLSRVRARDFAAGSLLGGAPRIVAYTALGSSGGDLSSPPALFGLVLVGAMGIAAATVVLARRLRPAAA